MSLSDLASIGSFVSGVAVLISLVYLSLQVRQAERNQQASIRDSRATRIVDIFMRSSEPSLTEAIAKGALGDEGISETQLRQFSWYLQARLIHAEEAFSQYKEGLLNQATFDQIGRALRAQFSFPGSRAIYSRIRWGYRDEFADYIDKIIASTPIGSAGNIWANFKSDVAAEKAKASV